jgi:hypothetical protein
MQTSENTKGFLEEARHQAATLHREIVVVQKDASPLYQPRIISAT